MEMNGIIEEIGKDEVIKAVGVILIYVVYKMMKKIKGKRKK